MLGHTVLTRVLRVLLSLEEARARRCAVNLQGYTVRRGRAWLKPTPEPTEQNFMELVVLSTTQAQH